MSVSFKGIASAIVAGAKKLKSEILKVAGEAPVIIAKIEADAPEVEALTSLVFPGAAKIEQLSVGLLEAVAEAVEAAGTAAGSNGLSVSFDEAVINDIKALLPQLKAFVAKGV